VRVTYARDSNYIKKNPKAEATKHARIIEQKIEVLELDLFSESKSLQN
jgi:hypothetical protein